MRPLLGTAALAALLLASACGVGGPVYPRFGNASYRVEGIMTAQNGGAPVSTVVYRDGAKMRVQTVLPGHGPATIVFDDATKAAYILTAGYDPLRDEGQDYAQALAKAGVKVKATCAEDMIHGFLGRRNVLPHADAALKDAAAALAEGFSRVPA